MRTFSRESGSDRDADDPAILVVYLGTFQMSTNETKALLQKSIWALGRA